MVSMDKIEFLNRLRAHYSAMDLEYNRVSSKQGFVCSGCQDNCCLTHFYHHTWLEFFYIKEGIHTLSGKEQELVVESAHKVVEKKSQADMNGVEAFLMCPLNMDGRCILYAYRPMICRLHGIKYTLHIPGQGIIQGPGCEEFVKQTENSPDIKIDRTPFYQEMAQLEREFREMMGITERFKRTVAEMILYEHRI